MFHHLLPLLFAAGFFAGTIDAIIGGGGLITLPVLLGVGMPPHMALGTSKLQSSCGTAIAMWRYARVGWLSFKTILIGMIPVIVGAAIGAYLSLILSAALLGKLIPFLLIIILIYTVLSPKLGHQETKPRIRETLFYFIFGSLLGFYDGFFGPGTGSFWMFTLVFFLGYSLQKATAYTKVFNLNSNLVGTLCFAVGGHIDYHIAFVMALGQVLGGWLGAHLAIKKGAVLIRPLFILVVTGSIATLVYKNYGSSIVVPTVYQLVAIGVMTSLFLLLWLIRIQRNKVPS